MAIFPNVRYKRSNPFQAELLMQAFVITRREDSLASIRASKALLKLKMAQEVILIVPKYDVEYFSNLLGELAKIYIHDENQFFPELDLDMMKKWGISHFPDRAGWYYQQFLKMSVALNEVAEEFYFIWDGDTVPFRKFDIFRDGHEVFSIHQKEFHAPYFQTNRILIGVDRPSLGSQFSAISQYMPIKKSTMKSLLSDLEKGQKAVWWQAIANVISQQVGMSLFSEYELYYDYVVLLKKLPHDSISLRWYRYAGSCTVDQKMFLPFLFDYASFEGWDEARRQSLQTWFRRWKEILRCSRIGFGAGLVR
ncbi:DUF6492 family protein [Methylobacterium phyllosphaerae]